MMISIRWHVDACIDKRGVLRRCKVEVLDVNQFLSKKKGKNKDRMLVCDIVSRLAPKN